MRLASVVTTCLAGAVALGILGVAGATWIGSRLRGLPAIETAVQEFSAGRLDTRIGLPRDCEIGRLAALIDDMAAQRQRHEEALTRSEENFRQIAENMTEVCWLSSPDKAELFYISPFHGSSFEPMATPGAELPSATAAGLRPAEGSYATIWGRTRADLYERPQSWLEAIHPDDRDDVAAASLRQARGEYRWRYRIVRPDGELRWISDRAFPVRRRDGSVYRIAGLAQDVTEQAQTELLLREQLEAGSDHEVIAAGIGNAAQRVAELTHQLLAFARRQPLEPQAVDVNRQLEGLDTMLRRTLGQHIDIVFACGGGIWDAMVDPAQLDGALVNLALNARNAMPHGGKLTIETANVHLSNDYAARQTDLAPGQYVLLAVSDTGTGIAREHLARVFEPFYTTRTAGPGERRGTGLGLSMVYGFAKQSRGDVHIYSEPGEGTTVKLYLPRAVAGRTETPAPAPAMPGSGNEYLLLVEDDHLVREFAGAQLETLGYRVLTARNGAEALAALERRDEVDLLFTDVVMPGGMSGRELADAVRERYPHIRVLYTSGYTENAILHHGRLEPGVRLLSKPYRRAELAAAVRQALTTT